MGYHTEHRIPSKITLAGEYSVVIGGSELTVPFHAFHVQVSKAGQVPPGMEKQALQSLRYMKELFEYISGQGAGFFHAPPDLSGFEQSLEQYWLEVDIPSGSGLGSSGAVCAAVYDMFFPGAGQLRPEQQKEDLALIESCFQGRSSGVEALTCYLNVPLYFRADGTVQPVDFDPCKVPGGYRFFLLNSEERFETGTLETRFLEKMKDPDFGRLMKEEYLMLNQKLIETLLSQRQADPAMLVKLVSEFQWQHFRAMIPGSMHDTWIEGQVSNEYYLKLNGSGGGFMLGITHSNLMETLSERWKEKLIWIA
jgi:mevalonate kinase